MQPHLILDEQSVAASRGVTFHLNQATKHPANPVLMPGIPGEWDSLQVSWPGTVLYDAEDKLFRCWYSGLDAIVADRPPGSWATGFAESHDGVHWTKPVLGQLTHRGRDTNRIVVNWSKYVHSGVWLNPDGNDRARKFLALWVTVADERWAMALASSPDGKVWTHERTAYKEVDRPGHLYITQVLYGNDATDPDWRTVAISRVMSKRASDGKDKIRHITLLHGPDPGHLSVVRHGAERSDHYVVEPETGIDDEIHLASFTKIGDTWLMLFESDRFTPQPPLGDLRLAATKDVRKFHRVHKRSALIPRGPRGSWDEALLVTSASSFQEVGDEVWIYYFGCSSVYTNWPPNRIAEPDLRGSYFYPVCMGLATLPRDRFAYAQGPGTVTTIVLRVGEDGVWLNLEGDASVEALNADGTVAAKGRVIDELYQTVYRKVAWDKTMVGDVSLRIELGAEAKLFAVRC